MHLIVKQFYIDSWSDALNWRGTIKK